jgi:hypothetical protein
MTVRADVAELLTAGYGNRSVARQLAISIGTVRRARTSLDLPPGRPGPKRHGSVEDLFWLRVRPTDDGHMQWTGTVHQGTTPVLRHAGRRYRAYRIAFRIAHHREPVGRVEPGCGRRGCVHPRHVEDRPMRQRTEATFAAIFGEAS